MIDAESGADISLTGLTPSNIDVSEKLLSALPIFMLVVLGLTFLLLMVAFSSILVPLKASLAILLSIGSSFGVVVAIFQWGTASARRSKQSFRSPFRMIFDRCHMGQCGFHNAHSSPDPVSS